MKNILLAVIVLCSFGGCIACAIKEDENVKTCNPICYPHTYKYVNAQNKCVCNTNLVIR